MGLIQAVAGVKLVCPQAEIAGGDFHAATTGFAGKLLGGFQ
jgi:hypothetical protein